MFGEVVFISEILGDVGYFDLDVLWAVNRILKVKVGDDEAGKIGARARQDTVDRDIDEFKMGNVCDNVARVSDVVAVNGGPCAVGIRFLGVDKTDNLGVGDLFASFDGDILITNEMKIVGALDILAGTVGSFTNSLTETTDFIEIGFIPNLREFGMNTQLVVIKELVCANVEYRHCPLGDESVREAVAGGLGGGENIFYVRACAVGNRLLVHHPCRQGRGCS